jgi:hypothetical protein
MTVLRMRGILFTVAAFAAVLIYLIWWVTYAGIHYIPRYTLQPPGASGEVQDASVRLLSLTRSDKLADQLADSDRSQPKIAGPGAVWIVAELEAVRRDPTKQFFCQFDLIGPQRRLWPSTSVFVTRSTPGCELDMPVGQPVRFELIFTVPARYADQLSGIALTDNSTAARTPVIRPPL